MTQTEVQLDRIIETFEMLDDWEERYRFLIDLGKQMKPMPEQDRTDANRVLGCQSQVWMTASLHGSDGQSPRLQFIAESDAFIVNGLIAILLSAYNGRPPREVIQFDAEGLFSRLGLVEHLSPTRRNGLHSMISRIREIAAGYASEQNQKDAKPNE